MLESKRDQASGHAKASCGSSAVKLAVKITQTIIQVSFGGHFGGQRMFVKRATCYVRWVWLLTDFSHFYTVP